MLQSNSGKLKVIDPIGRGVVTDFFWKSVRDRPLPPGCSERINALGANPRCLNNGMIIILEFIFAFFFE